MGFPQSYTKKLRLSRELSNEFVSIRQFLQGISEIEHLTNSELQDLVVNRAYQYSVKYGIMKKLKELCDNNRVNGATIVVRIDTENWVDMVQTVGLAKRWNRLDEWDLFEDCLKVYIEQIKLKRCLP